MASGQRKHRLQRLQGRLVSRAKRLQRLDQQFLRVRLIGFLAGSLLVAFAFIWLDSLIGWLLLVLLAVILIVIAVFHRSVRQSLTRLQIRTTIQKRQMARLALEWEQIPLSPFPAGEGHHPFRLDLDLTGPRSLHQLLDTSLSQDGSRRLRDWLLETTPEAAKIETRQSLVKETSGLSIFRNRLAQESAQLTDESGEKWDTPKLLRWLQQPQNSGWLVRDLRISALLLALFALLLLLDLVLGIGRIWALALFVYGALLITRQEALSRIFQDGVGLEAELRRMAGALQLLERFEPAGKPRLAALLEPLHQGITQPSSELSTLAGLISMMSVRAFPLAWLPLNLIFPWDFFFAHRLDRVRSELSQAFPIWLEIFSELEAVNSLANFSHLHPGYAFPSMEVAGASRLQARRVGHPLIAGKARIANDFDLSLGQIVVLTGSNMSGKSTFLRTIGVNLVLAFSGAPVCAEEFSTSLFRLFSCIRVSDSIADGFSYFYAEVRRLKDLLNSLDEEQPPLLYLIDEIFKGTNNRERLIGSRSFVRTLSGTPSLGLISTHDLDLTRLEEELPSVLNFHFREEVRNGNMHFDYRLRPGPCPTTNALKIMQLEGLPVDLPEPEV